MTRIRDHFIAAIVLFVLPGMAWACAYPAPLRSISATLISVQDMGGQVGTYHRAQLHRALGQTDAATLMQGLSGEVSRADLRAVASVLALSQALANGMGRTLSAEASEQAHHLAGAIRTDCRADTKAKAHGKTTDATLEQDHTRATNVGASALTFRQGLARLSLTFTIYMTFLALVIGLRRQHGRIMRNTGAVAGPPPGGRPFLPKEAGKLSGV